MELGTDPSYRLEPAAALPEGDAVLERIRAGGHPKVVALVGYHDDEDAGRIARRLPYGPHGEGVEEIVFCRTGPPTGAVVQFADDAWPGEDRTYVLDEVEPAVDLATRFAVEYGAEGALVLVTGGEGFLADVLSVLRRTVRP